MSGKSNVRRIRAFGRANGVELGLGFVFNPLAEGFGKTGLLTYQKHQEGVRSEIVNIARGTNMEIVMSENVRDFMTKRFGPEATIATMKALTIFDMAKRGVDDFTSDEVSLTEPTVEE